MQLPTHRKYAIALTVYIVISVLEGTYLYMPVPVMMAMCLCNGLLGVTSYTIRISATQSLSLIHIYGRFVKELKDISLQFRGSRNQRVIDMDRTREAGEITIWEKLRK